MKQINALFREVTCCSFHLSMHFTLLEGTDFEKKNGLCLSFTVKGCKGKN